MSRPRCGVRKTVAGPGASAWRQNLSTGGSRAAGRKAVAAERRAYWKERNGAVSVRLSVRLRIIWW
jgi:hypothetical protein